MNDENIDRIELNGAPAQAGDLKTLALVNYGHFTSIPVRERSVRGLGLHLDRLAEGTRELFGRELDCARVRDCLRHAIGADERPMSARVTIFSRALNRERPVTPVTPDILVTLAPTLNPTMNPARVQAFRYTRELPQIKHVGTFPLFHYRRLAQSNGFDDALFVDADGYIAEGSTWNIGFHDGHGVVWPRAPQLAGVGMRLLQVGLARSGIPRVSRPVRLEEAVDFRAAFLVNSNSIARPIACIDKIEFAIDDSLTTRLRQCYETNPWEIV